MAGSFFDTDILLYLASGDTLKADRAETLLREGGVTSVQVQNEWDHVARRKMRMEWTAINACLSTLRELPDVRAVEVRTHETGLELAERYQLGIYDAILKQDTPSLRPVGQDDVAEVEAFVPLILKFMLRGETQGDEIQNKICSEKRLALRVTPGPDRKTAKPNASPGSKFQDNFYFALGDYMQRHLKILEKTSPKAVTESGMRTYRLLPGEYNHINADGLHDLLPAT